MKDSVSKTLQITLYQRALDAKSDRPILNDRYAAEILDKLPKMEKPIKKGFMSYPGVLARARFFDERVKEFIRRYPDPVIVNCACGLDTRSLRCYDENTIFYDVDLPDVIVLRNELIDDKSQTVGMDLFSPAFIELFKEHKDKQFCFVFEGFFMYFEKEPIVELLRSLQEEYHGVVLGDFNFGDFWEKHQEQHDMADSFKEMGVHYRSSFASMQDLEDSVPNSKITIHKGYYDADFKDAFGWRRILFYLGPKKKREAMQLLEVEI